MTSSKRLAFVFLFVLPFLTACQNETGTWYDYGNGALNLDNVSNINPYVDYTITIESDALEDMHTQYKGALTEDKISEIMTFLAPESITNQGFYKIYIRSYILFDDFDLTLWESEKYLLRPNGKYIVTESFLKGMANEGATKAMLSSLEPLKGKIFNDKQKFINAVTTSIGLEQDAVINELVSLLGQGEKALLFSQEVDSSENELLITSDQYEIISKGLNSSYAAYRALPIF